jgi:competence protein ComEC
MVAGRAVLLEPARAGRFGAAAPVEVLDGPAAGLRLLARTSGRGLPHPSLRPGAVVELRGQVLAPPSDRAWAAHLRREGIAAELEAVALSPTGARRGGWRGVVDAMRNRAERALGTGLEAPEAALARGMVLGQDEEISDVVRDDFRRAGIAHLLAVSGQNVMLLAALAVPLLALAGLGLRTRLWAVLALIAVYVPLAGAGPSLQRAAVMGAAGLAALLASRPASRWYALGLAAAVTLGVDPRAVGDPGWQLSFVAVAGIFMTGPSGVRSGPGARAASFARTLSARLGRAALDGTRITVAAGVATSPLLALHFGSVSLAGLPANVLALPAVAPVMWTGMLQTALGQLGGLPVAGAVVDLALTALSPVAEAGLRYLGWLADRFAEAPGATVDSGPASAGGILAAYAVLLACVVLARRLVPRAAARAPELRARWDGRPRGQRAAVVLGATALVALGIARWLGPGRPPEALTVSFLDVGQGDATLVQHPDGGALLFDAGPPEGRAAGLLHRAGVRRLSLVVATHASRDHHGGLVEVLERYPVDLLLDGGDGSRDPAFRRVLVEARRRGIEPVPAVAGQVLRAGAVTVRILGPAPRPPGPPPEDPNPRAVVALVSAGGFDLFLAGDAESEALGHLPLGDVEAMKVSHHGSADAGLPALLARLRPEVAAIEVGAGNPYGHPAPETLVALRAAGPRVFRTDEHGTVRLEVTRGGMAVETER